MRHLISETELLDSSTLNHIRQSESLILESSGNCNSGNVLIIGGGKCTEIPVSGLLEKHDNIEIIDLNYTSLRFIQDKFKRFFQRLNCYCADITGMIEKVRYSGSQILLNTENPTDCVEMLAHLISESEPDFWRPLNNKKYQLVIASCVLTQLQAYVRKALEQAFLEKFPNYIEILLTNEIWRIKCRKLAMNLEIKFIEYLNSLVEKNGIIYLSGTVGVSWLKKSNVNGAFCTDGYWLAINKKNLVDYLSKAHTVLVQKQWQWLRLETEADCIGRLYNVQAIIYRAEEIDNETVSDNNNSE